MFLLEHLFLKEDNIGSSLDGSSGIYTVGVDGINFKLIFKSLRFQFLAL